MSTERLKQLMTELYNCGFDEGAGIQDVDTRHETSVRDDIVSIFTASNEAPELLARQVEALTKRVAELEAKAAEVVAKLLRRRDGVRPMGGIYDAYERGKDQAYEEAAALVAEKLGVK